MLDRIELLERLAELRRNGALTDDEYSREKAKLLSSNSDNLGTTNGAEHSRVAAQPGNGPVDLQRTTSASATDESCLSQAQGWDGHASIPASSFEPRFDKRTREGLIVGGLGVALLLVLGLAKYGLPTSLWIDRTQPLESDPQVVRVVKAQYADASNKNDKMGACVAAGLLGSMYANAEDDDNSEFWVQTGEGVCSTIPGVKELQKLGRELEYLPNR